ncbi:MULTISPECIES: GFA family protein [unclassified Halomonas]|uniref:GFA family protein n=1 Tax=unclassified Halomonas TaxID=2609666 RepID=UPI0009EF58CA|nr:MULTISPECIES: GFA family protein [unclassified Halomonas]MBT2788521.1 GFA family protein [Halomonas sp. ISL-106]MBT2798112.1 GFA family protein [Halomonas sp. ISL-104]
MKGECLCGEVVFEVKGELPNLYQCHCSLCRKATGSNANAATFVDGKHFHWLSGLSSIRSFQKPTGYRSDFCSVCGSPVPNKLRDTDLIWVPAGLLDETTAAQVAVHLHLSSAATWAQDLDSCVRLAGGPDSLESLHDALQWKRD